MSTANICLSYAVETMAGVRPTSGYIMMPEVIGTSELNPENPLESVLAYEAFYTDEQAEIWWEVMKTYDKAIKQGLAIWFCVSSPKLDLAIFYQGKPLTIKPVHTLSLGSTQYLGMNLRVVPLSAVERGENPLKVGSVDYEKNIVRENKKKSRVRQD